MDQSRKSPSGNMDERIRQYAEELMQAYRRQNPPSSSLSSRPPSAREHPQTAPEPSEAAAPLIPEEPIRGEIPPAPPERGSLSEEAAAPPTVSSVEEPPRWPLFPVDSPVFREPIRPAPPPASRQETDRSAHPNPGITLRPTLPVPTEEEPISPKEKAPAEPGPETSEAPEEEAFLPPMVVEPPEEGEFAPDDRDDAILAFPGRTVERTAERNAPAIGDVSVAADDSAAVKNPENVSVRPEEQPDEAGTEAADTETAYPILPNGSASEPLAESPSLAAGADIAGESPSLPDQPSPAPPSTGTARLRVWVTTARQAVPIEGAQVIVCQEGEDGKQALCKVLSTNPDGSTETVELPAVPAEYSQTPGVAHPYTSYPIEVSKPGYFTVRNNHVPLYGGILAIQPVDLTHLPENMSGAGTSPNEIIYNESGPQEL